MTYRNSIHLAIAMTVLDTSPPLGNLALVYIKQHIYYWFCYQLVNYRFSNKCIWLVILLAVFIILRGTASYHLIHGLHLETVSHPHAAYVNFFFSLQLTFLPSGHLSSIDRSQVQDEVGGSSPDVPLLSCVTCQLISVHPKQITAGFSSFLF